MLEEIQKRAKGRKIVSLAGSIDPRKGTMMLMRLAQALYDKDFFFVIVGKIQWRFFGSAYLLKAFVESAPENCFILDQSIETDWEFDALLAQSDVVYSVMEYDYSSNIVTKAALLERPVLVSERGPSAIRVLKYRTGLCIPENNLWAASKALERLTQSRWQGDWHGFQKEFSIENLGQVVARAMETKQ